MYVNSSDFPREYLNLNNNKLKLDINKLKLMRCVMMAGSGNYSEFYGRGFYRLCHLATLVLANVESCENGVKLHDSFFELDQSEKVPVSYHLGTGLTKAFAEQHLNVPWLSHVSSFKDRIKWNGQPVTPKISLYTSTKKAKEPDLVGYDSNGNPHILESKGYSTGFVGSILQHAINQVSQVSNVSGSNPRTRVACFHDLSKVPFYSRIVDPEFPGDDEGCSINLTFKDVIKSYYQVFLDEGVRYSRHDIFEREYKLLDLSVDDLVLGVDLGLLKSIFDYDNLEEELHTFKEHRQRVIKSEGIEGYIDIGTDGVLIANKHKLQEVLNRDEVKHNDGTVNRLINSDSFSETHHVLKLFNESNVFSVRQVNDLVRAALENSQIRWVVSDDDVASFYRKIVNDYESVIDSDMKKEIYELLTLS